MRFLALDIEAIEDVELGRELLFLKGKASRESLRAVDDATIRAAMNEQRASEPGATSGFQKAAFWRVVAIGLCGIDTTRGKVLLRATAGDNERTMLQELEEAINQWRRPRLVTFNGNCFDLPVLRYRGIRHGVTMPALISGGRETYFYRYGDSHLDVKDVLGNFGASTGLTLEEASTLCGLPAKVAGTWADVWPLFHERKFESLEGKVLEDAIGTALLALRFGFSRGDLEHVDFQRAVREIRRATVAYPLLAEALNGPLWLGRDYEAPVEAVGA